MTKADGKGTAKCPFQINSENRERDKVAKEMLRMQGITKIYSNGFVANKNVTFSVNAHEIHALVGENGAGKTTLMKILFGMEDFQEGAIFIDGKEVSIKSPLDSIAHGIGMVHQHFMLLSSLTVAENVVLGMEPMRHGIFDMNEAIRMTQEIADKYQFNIDAKSKVGDLSVGMMQKVEILKALIKGGKVLILVEPTAVLTPQETVELFEQLRLMRQAGHAIIFISHKLEEVMALCDRITVLRHGYSQGTYSVEDLNPAKISKLMVGRDVCLSFDKPEVKRGAEVLKVEKLVYKNDNGKSALNNISFKLRGGEILGVAGVEGNGQTELLDVLGGILPATAGEILLNGKKTNGLSVRQIRELGMSYIPEDRMVQGTAPELTVRDNILADRYNDRKYSVGPLIKDKAINQATEDYIKKYEINCDDRNEPVRMLSGGNIQKVVVAREFTHDCVCMLASQPTRGIDVGTVEMIRRNMIHKSREEGIGILLVSADLNELLELSDRLIVLREGQIVAAFDKANRVTEEELGEYMLGLKRMTEQEMEGQQ